MSRLQFFVFLIISTQSLFTEFQVVDSNCINFNYSTNGKEPPIVKLVESKFHTNDSVIPDSCGYNLPITFQTLKFMCTSTYPTIWKFEIPPHEDIRLKDFSISKIRRIVSFFDTDTYTYESNLTLNFKDPLHVPTIFCSENKPHNLTTTISSVSSSDTFRIIVKIERSDNGIKSYEDKRLGKNKNCNVTLEINTKTNRFQCGHGSRPQFIQCSNPDECNSVFVLDDNWNGENKAFCNNTFISNGCPTQAKCIQFSPSFSPAVIICRDGFGNSIARKYIVYPSKNDSQRPQMRLGRDISRGHLPSVSYFDLEETIKLNKNATQIYFGEEVSFSCKAVGSYYSYGFVWAKWSNSRMTILESDKEEFNLTSQSYFVHKTILFPNDTEGNMFQIICLGPRWNNVDWVNSTSETFEVKYPEKPELRQQVQSELNHDKTSTTYTYTFTCVTVSKPVSQITWIWNNITLTHTMVDKLYSTTHVSNEDTGEASSTLKITLRGESDEPRHNLTCEGENFIGKVQHSFILDSKTSLSVIIGIVLGILLIVTTVSVFLITRHYYRKKLQLLSDEEIEEFKNGNSQSAENALVLPYSIKNEIPQEKVTFLDSMVLGEGQGGVVFKGKYNSRTVAIKTIKKDSDVRYFKALLAEIKIMCYVEKHDNLVNIVGACTKEIRKREIFLITEYCENGDLLAFLKQTRGVCLDLFHSDKSNNDYPQLIKIQKNTINVMPCMSTINLLHWCYDIASGMEFLCHKGIIHGDLAARNVLLTNTFIAKIGDFGLSKKIMENYSIYVQKLECPLPLKWLAIESLKDFEFSSESDVWAYGVTIWEIFTLGERPYPGIVNWNFESHTLLSNGYRMDKPTYSNDNIYRIMLACWNESPNARPSFTQLKQFFKKQLSSM